MLTIKSIAHSSSVLLVVLLLAFSTMEIIPAQAARVNSADAPVGLSANDWVQIKNLLPAAAITSQQAYLKASNTETNDGFRAVAVSANTVAVGAPEEDSNATGVNGNQANNSAPGSGAVYVFIRSGSTWSQQAYIKASNTAAGTRFGHSVAISGETLVVGTSYAEAVYIFIRSGTTWSQQAYLQASNTQDGDMFGQSVAISGDTLAVGATEEASSATGVNGNQADNSAIYSGAAYVFVRSGSAWSQQAYIKASNTEAEDYFGVRVAISGDTLAVGASEEDSNATGVNGNEANNLAPGSGAAYVFTRSGTTWSQQSYLKASNTEAGDHFGVTLAISGATIAVAASVEGSDATGVNGNQANNSALGSGAAYVFTRSGTTWSQQAYLKASNTEAGDRFGYSLAISGNTVAVGAIFEDSNAIGVNGDQANNLAPNSGAAYIFTRSGTTWSQQAYLKASNTDIGDCFGCTVNVSGDMVVVGATNEASNATGVNGNQTDNSAPWAGAAYIFATNTTMAFLSQAANDGWILESGENTKVGGSTNNAALTFNLGDAATKRQYLSILSFSTGAGLPDNAIITAVTLKVKKQGIVGGGNPVATFQGFMVDIKNGFFGTSVLQAADFQTLASKTYGPFNTALVGGWYSINLTTGKTYINKLATNGGLTQIRLRFKLDDNNNAIANYLSLFSGNAPAVSRPQLVITYYVP